MSSLSDYKNHVYTNLPSGMTTSNGKFTYNSRRFNNFPEASRYRNYLLKTGGSLSAQVAALFGPSDTGWFYDNSDFSTMFQDSAGTTPVTAVGQSVGLQLDKSGNGNHRFQSVSLNRPTLARHPVGGRRNLLTYTEQFDNAAYKKIQCTITTNAEVAPDGTSTADKIVPTNTIPAVEEIITVAASSTVSGGCYFKAAEKGFGYIQINGQTGGTPRASFVSVDLATGAVGSITALAGGGLVTPSASVSDAGNGWWRLSLSGGIGASNTVAVFYIGVSDAQDSRTVTVSGSDGIYLWGAQLELGSTATAYQRVTTAYDVTEAGVPDQYYLSYNGTNNSLATSAFDWGTDKATVVAGYTRKGPGAGIVCEFSPTVLLNAKSFYFVVNDGGRIHSSSSRGSAGANIAQAAIWTTAESLPTTSVISVTHDIAGDLSTIRKNGVAGNNGTGDKGTGNFGNYPVYFGARAGTSALFLGDEYSQFAISRLLTESELELVESYTNSRTGAY